MDLICTVDLDIIDKKSQYDGKDGCIQRFV